MDKRAKRIIERNRLRRIQKRKDADRRKGTPVVEGVHMTNRQMIQKAKSLGLLPIDLDKKLELAMRKLDGYTLQTYLLHLESIERLKQLSDTERGESERIIRETEEMLGIRGSKPLNIIQSESKIILAK